MIDDDPLIGDASFDGFGYVQGFQIIRCRIAHGDPFNFHSSLAL